MSEKNIEMMKNFIEAKKNKNSGTASGKIVNVPGKTSNPELKSRKAFRNRKSGGVFDK